METENAQRKQFSLSNEKENRQAKTFSSYDFRFSVFVRLFSAVRTETENGKGIHYPFCVCRFGKSGKAKNVVLLRFSFGFPGNEKTQVGFLFNLTFFLFLQKTKNVSVDTTSYLDR